jgi:SAM-dependent methyltransferase
VNILELISKQHPQVRTERWDAPSGAWQAVDDAKSLITKVSHQRVERKFLGTRTVAEQVRGIRLEPGMRIVVREAARHWAGFAAGKGVFYAKSVSARESALRLAWQEGERPVGETDFALGSALHTLKVPATPSGAADLVIEVLADRAPVFLGVHVLLDRSVLYRHCKGKGVEIGPGPKPQILPAPDVDVTYVEQATPDQWERLYGKDTKTPVDPALWERYVVGNADSIPAPPDSLDFIFSSHVVEHLANPLGHLAYWATLLRKGGVVAAVIPDLEGCKDFVFRASPVDELAREFEEGDMAVKLRHYERWAEHRAPGREPADILASGRSIHVHFYTPASMRQILDRHARSLGYRTFEVTSSPNHKDFFVLLRK